MLVQTSGAEDCTGFLKQKPVPPDLSWNPFGHGKWPYFCCWDWSAYVKRKIKLICWTGPGTEPQTHRDLGTQCPREGAGLLRRAPTTGSRSPAGPGDVLSSRPGPAGLVWDRSLCPAAEKQLGHLGRGRRWSADPQCSVSLWWAWGGERSPRGPPAGPCPQPASGHRGKAHSPTSAWPLSHGRLPAKGRSAPDSGGQSAVPSHRRPHTRARGDNVTPTRRCPPRDGRAPARS